MRSPRFVGALLLIALLFVPIAFSGHVHAHATSACSVCAVTHHTTAITRPVGCVEAPQRVASLIAPVTLALTTAGVVTTPVGRGPPATPCTFV